MIERKESILTMHRSNQNKGLCYSQVDHNVTTRSVSQHISNNMRSSFDTGELKKRTREYADSSRSKVKYGKETRLISSNTLSIDSS